MSASCRSHPNWSTPSDRPCGASSPTARVVLNGRGTTPGRANVLAALKALLQRENLQERLFHALRHSFCSFLVRRGASAEVVRLLAGHGDLYTMQGYVHAAGGELKAAIAKFSGN
jgi:site-specific recombinase XerD